METRATVYAEKREKQLWKYFLFFFFVKTLKAFKDSKINERSLLRYHGNYKVRIIYT